MITESELIPSVFKTGIIVPIPKGDKPKEIQDNYRGITLLSVFAKLYEKCIMLRLDEKLKANDVLSGMQGAAQNKSSSLHSAWLVREIISFNVEKNNDTFICLLDTKKAFDSVWQDGLLYKLFNETGLHGKTYRIICELFKDFKCCIRLGNIISPSFLVKQGIHQGAPCSMVFYNIFINELLKKLNNVETNVSVAGQGIGAIGYADDIALVSVSCYGLQNLVSIAYNYSRKWRFVFNSRKCSVLYFGSNRISIPKVKLGNEEIEYKDTDMHLGTILTSKNVHVNNLIDERIEKCKRLCYSFKGLGNWRVPVTPVTCNKLYQSLCVPKLFYGLELLSLNEVSISKLSAFHIEMSKYFQGLPSNTCNVGSLQTMGWNSIDSIIAFRALILLWQLIKLPMSSIYKRVCIYRLSLILLNEWSHCGPIHCMVDYCRRFGLMKELCNAVFKCEVLNTNKWKSYVKFKIQSRELKRFIIIKQMYSSLSIIFVHENAQLSAWWYHCYHDPQLVKQNMYIMRLTLNVFMYKRSIYPLCSMSAINSIHHILMSCDSVFQERTTIRYGRKSMTAYPISYSMYI